MFYDGATGERQRKRHLGGSATLAPMRTIARDVVQRAHPEWDARDRVLNPNRVSAGFYWSSYDVQGRYALSGTIGILVTGLDGTVQVRDRTYLTAGMSLPGQVQGFLQQRLVNAPSIKVAVGFGYRRDLLTFTEPCSSENYCLDFETIPATSVGARSFLIYHDRKDDKTGLRLGIYTGYALQINRPLIDVTLTVGVF